MAFFGSSKERDELDRLRTRRQIGLYVDRENARRIRAERRSAEARVRQLNFELIARVVLLALTVGIGVGLLIGFLGNPDALKAAVLGATAWATVAVALLRLSRADSD